MKVSFRSIALVALTCFSCSSMAAEFFLDGGDDLAKSASRSVVLVGFTGNQDITDAQSDVNFDPQLVSVSVKSFGNAVCTNPKPGLIRVISPDLGGKSLGEKVAAYCQITVKSLKGALPQNALKLSNVFCSGIAGVEKSCAGAETSKN